MAISELLEEDREKLRIAIQSALPEDAVKQLTKKARDLVEDISSQVEWYIKDDLSDSLAYHVREMTERVVEALLAGNHNEMVRWLNCSKSGYNGRSDGANLSSRKIEDQHQIIHGKLHECQTIALRRKIAEAHSDLIRNERIADLEDQVLSLVAQNNKMKADLDQAREELRGLR